MTMNLSDWGQMSIRYTIKSGCQFVNVVVDTHQRLLITLVVFCQLLSGTTPVASGYLLY